MTSCLMLIKSGKDPGKKPKGVSGESRLKSKVLYVPQFYDAAYKGRRNTAVLLLLIMHTRLQG